MNISEGFVLDVIYLLFPLLLYFLYIAYNRNIGKKENNLFLEVSLFSSLYLLIRYGEGLFGGMPFLILNIPLLIAYLKDRKLGAIAISVFLIVYYHSYFSYPIWLSLLEYISFYLLFCLKQKRKWKDITFSLTSFAVLSLYFIPLMFIKEVPISAVEILIGAVFTLSVQLLVGILAVFLLIKGDDIMNFHMSLKDLEQEKQIRSSLFKITHEIKNPIAVCKGYLDMFDVNNTDHSRKYVPILREEMDRTLVLLEDFLCMTKISVEKDLIDINLVVENVVESFKPMLKEKGMKSSLELLEDDVEIYGDYNRLIQVFFNILKNSLEAMTPSKGEINIYLEDEPDLVRIYFEDNGCGITTENLKKIKEPFFTTKVRGTGLGVSLSYEIVESHGGTIKYISELKKGTTVIITLPKEDKERTESVK